VTAPDCDFNLPRLERYLGLVQASGAAPVIVLNKSDLTNDVIGAAGQIATIAPGVPVHAVSARGRDAMGDLDRYFVGNRTIVLVGSSGVGKSTLTNELLGRAAQAIQEVRARDSRGRHTTIRTYSSATVAWAERVIADCDSDQSEDLEDVGTPSACVHFGPRSRHGRL